MSNLRIYEALAQAFRAEGVDTFFTLMGDANMHWAISMSHIEGMNVVHVRHEHCAVAMSIGYHGATGKVGVASVTCGPGFTQTMTALTSAHRNRIPLVVFAGEIPIHAKWYGQQIEQPPLAAPTGAHYIQAHSPQRMFQYVRDAFYIAQTERRPVVLGVPYDLQKQAMPEVGEYQPSAALIPLLGRALPDPEQVELLAQRLLDADCPVIVAGRGAMFSDADEAIEALAERTGAFLSTTLPARGMFDHNPFSLGVSGGYARAVAREIGAKADFVLTVGASISYHTIDAGSMFPKAEIAQIDIDPLGFNHGAKTADIHVRGDAKATIEAVGQKVGSRRPRGVARTEDLARRIREEPADATDIEIEPGLLDPRKAIAEMDEVVPKDFFLVEGSGHQAYFQSVMRGRRPENFLVYKEFGAIGNAMSFAIGAAVSRGDGRLLLIEGDGSFLMHIQELETVKRHGVKLLFCIMNDGAFGAEIHKLREDGVDDREAIFGRPDFAAIANGFGLRGATVTDVAQFAGLMEEYDAGDTAMVWNIYISDKVVSPRMRGAVKRGHGVI